MRTPLSFVPTSMDAGRDGGSGIENGYFPKPEALEGCFEKSLNTWRLEITCLSSRLVLEEWLEPVRGGITTFSFPYKCTASSPLLITLPLFTITLPWTQPPATYGTANISGNLGDVGHKAKATKHRRTSVNGWKLTFTVNKLNADAFSVPHCGSATLMQVRETNDTNQAMTERNVGSREMLESRI
jgi:hypothetical protein